MKKELSFIYIAVDGKKFTNELEALEYERNRVITKTLFKKKSIKFNNFIK